ncbi:MAG: PAS domain S-box protein, partial [Spirochaeta sp.]
MRIPSVLSSSRGRFFLSIGIVIFAVYGVIAVQAYIHIGYYLDLRRTELRRIVDVGVTSMRPVLNEYQAGDIGYLQARRRIVQNIRGLSYQEDGFPNFFFVGTYEMAPITSTSEFYGSGTQPVEAYRLLSFEVLQELAALARSEQGRGFITYEADSADGSSQRKIAYIRGIPELGIYIGTRLSTSDINQAISEVVIRSVLIGTCLVLLTAFFLVLALRPLARLTRILSQVFTRIADDPNESLQAVNTQPLPWAEGEAIFNGLQRMLTSLRTARFRQEESEDRFRRLFSESRDAILLTNGLQILECNQRAEGFLQMRRDVLIGSDIRDVLLRSPSLSDSELIELLERAIDGETVEIALELPENGEALVRRYADVSIYPQYLDMEFGFQVVMHDITTIRQTEQMLQNLSENLYRTLYSIGDGIIATDADGSITRMNKVAEDLTGWTQHGAVGLSLNEVVQLRDIATGS